MLSREQFNQDLPQASVGIPTLGLLSADGSVIERLRGGLLALWTDGDETIGQNIEYRTHLYTAAPLEPSLEKTLRLPFGSGDFGTTEELLHDLISLFSRYVPGLDENSRWLAAAFVVSTWVAERLPTAPVLNIWGEVGAYNPLLLLLSALCRHPLPLQQLAMPELGRLPEGIYPTVLILRPAESSIRQLLAGSASANLYQIKKGKCTQLNCGAALFTDKPISHSALKIPVSTEATHYVRLRASDLDDLAVRLQPKLLRYRFCQHREADLSSFDVPAFAPEVRTVARWLGATFEGDPELQCRLMEALRHCDEDSQYERAQSAPAIILESLLCLCHEHRRSALVSEIAELANGVLLGRHDSDHLTVKRTGCHLRELGLSAKRQAAGYALTFDQATSRRIHRLAESYAVPSMLNPCSGCEFCGPALSPTTEAEESGWLADTTENGLCSVLSQETCETEEGNAAPQGEKAAASVLGADNATRA